MGRLEVTRQATATEARTPVGILEIGLIMNSWG